MFLRFYRLPSFFLLKLSLNSRDLIHVQLMIGCLHFKIYLWNASSATDSVEEVAMGFNRHHLLHTKPLSKYVICVNQSKVTHLCKSSVFGMETQPQKVSSNPCSELLYRNSGAVPHCPQFFCEHTYLIPFKPGPHLFLV